MSTHIILAVKNVEGWLNFLLTFHYKLWAKFKISDHFSRVRHQCLFHVGTCRQIVYTFWCRLITKISIFICIVSILVKCDPFRTCFFDSSCTSSSDGADFGFPEAFGAVKKSWKASIGSYVSDSFELVKPQSSLVAIVAAVEAGVRLLKGSKLVCNFGNVFKEARNSKSSFSKFCFKKISVIGIVISLMALTNLLGNLCLYAETVASWTYTVDCSECKWAFICKQNNFCRWSICWILVGWLRRCAQPIANQKIWLSYLTLIQCTIYGRGSRMTRLIGSA